MSPRKGWWKRLLARIARFIVTRFKDDMKRQHRLAEFLPAPRLTIDHPREADIREWAAAHLPCWFTASDGMVTRVTDVEVRGGGGRIKVAMSFVRSQWSNAEDDRLATDLLDKATHSLVTWLDASVPLAERN